MNQVTQNTSNALGAISLQTCPSEPLTPITDNSAETIAVKFQATAEVGPLATSDQKVRDFAIGLEGYRVAERVQANGMREAKNALLAKGMALVAADSGTAVLVEGPCMTDRLRNGENQRDGIYVLSRLMDIASGALIERRESALADGAKSNFTVVRPLAEIVGNMQRSDDWLTTASFGVRDERPSENKNAIMDVGSTQMGGRRISAVYIVAPDRTPVSGLSQIATLIDIERCRVSLLEPRQDSIALELLVQQHGFVASSYVPSSQAQSDLAAKGINLQNLSFVTHAESGIIIGMGRRGTNMLVVLPEDKLIAPVDLSLLGKDLNTAGPKASSLTTAGYNGTEFLLLNTQPAVFSSTIDALIRNTGIVFETQTAHAAQQRLEQEQQQQRDLAAESARHARTKLLGDTAQEVGEISAKTPQDFNQADLVVRTLLEPFGIQHQLGRFVDYVAIHTPGELSSLVRQALSSKASKVTEAPISKELADQAIANTKVWHFTHPTSELSFTLAAVRTDVVRANVHWTVSVEGEGKRDLSPKELEALLKIPHSTAFSNALPFDSTREQLPPIRRLMLYINRPADLINLIESLSALQDSRIATV